MKKSSSIFEKLSLLQKDFEGEIFTGDAIRLMYATDASAYREIPIAVTYPKNDSDIRKLILFAGENQISLIPRAAGTSLAGQVVGNGLVVDISKHFNKIAEVNKAEHWVKVQPGVVLDELNKFLEFTGLFFAPETSTSNRCMIAGMLGNNSCGAHSLVYGSTRDHTLEVKTLLSDGSEVLFGALNKSDFLKKCQLTNLEGDIYRYIQKLLSDRAIHREIEEQFPDKAIRRRNTGYALDELMDCQIFGNSTRPFNFSKLLAGSEGTLAFTTEIKLHLVPLPPKYKALIPVHLHTVEEALKANLVALQHGPRSIELTDKILLDLTRKNIGQRKNRFFVEGDPGAILIVEFAENSEEVLLEKVRALEQSMRASGYGYHFPLITGSNMKKVWDLRKAGLGIINNMPGDAKPVAVIEDTAVRPDLLPDYISEFDQILKKYHKKCVYYAHIATGELHLRPVLNLKNPDDVKLFYQIGLESAKLVKKYHGSLSGEHGDGRLRGEFIPLMVGKYIYEVFKQIKNVWDPNRVFNHGKITGTPSMNTHLRYMSGQKTPEIKTYFNFSTDLGIVRSAEKCNGTGLCRKSEIIGGTMCPSYMATHDENKSTRARANILRELLSKPNQKNPFDHKEIYQVLDLCLMCKACKSECPSSVDITKLKAEFLQHYYQVHGVPLRSLLIANISKISYLGSFVPAIYNFFQKSGVISKIMAKILGFAQQRKFPLLSAQPLDRWFSKNKSKLHNSTFRNGKVYLFNDEFTRFNDTDIGIKAIKLLTELGYEVVIPQHFESSRTYLSKGLIKKAKKIANKNIYLLKDKIDNKTPLVGIEPSAILTFRDEYRDLASKSLQRSAEKLAANSLMIDEFLEREIKAGKIRQEQFTTQSKHIKLHGHCHQKSLASTAPTLFVLGFPENFTVEEIPSGCCGMAGAFGFEKEHYEMSMQVGELVLFPAIRNISNETLIAAPGTSCRHQIKDGTQRSALHPIEILYDALEKQ